MIYFHIQGDKSDNASGGVEEGGESGERVIHSEIASEGSGRKDKICYDG